MGYYTFNCGIIGTGKKTYRGVYNIDKARFSPEIGYIFTNGLALRLDAGDSSSYSGTGTTWTDLSGNGNNGTLVNGVGYNSDDYKSLSFDGSDDYVKFSSRILTSSITEISCFLWVYPVSDGVILSILGQSNIQTSYHHSCIEIDSSGTLEMSLWHGGLSNRVTSSLIYNTWNYIGYTYSGTTLTGYVNGSSAGTTTFTWSKPSNIYFGIMARDTTNMGTSSYGHGNVSDFHVYDRALTALEVEKNFNSLKERYMGILLSSNYLIDGVAANTVVSTLSVSNSSSIQTFSFSLVSGTGDTDNSSFTITGNSLKINAAPNISVQSSYSIRIKVVNLTDGRSFEKSFTITVIPSTIISNGLALHLDAGDSSSYQGSGTTWYDLSSSGNDGTLTNGPTHTSGAGGYFTFDGSDDYVQMSNSIANVSAATYIAWIKRDGTQNSYTGIIGARTTTYNGMHFNNNGTNLHYSWNNSYYGWNSGLTIPDAEWCMCVVSISSSSATAYVCTSLGINSATNTGTHSTTTIDDIEIGRDDYTNNRYFDGDISQVIIYDRALTATEVTQNFNTLKWRFGL